MLSMIIIQGKWIVYTLKLEKNEKVYKLFSFHGINIWNHMSRKIPIHVSYACYKRNRKIIIIFFYGCQSTNLLITLFLIFFIITHAFSYVFISIILYSILLILINLPLQKIVIHLVLQFGPSFTTKSCLLLHTAHQAFMLSASFIKAYYIVVLWTEGWSATDTISIAKKGRHWPFTLVKLLHFFNNICAQDEPLRAIHGVCPVDILAEQLHTSNVP